MTTIQPIRLNNSPPGSPATYLDSTGINRVSSISNLKDYYGRIIVVSNRLPVSITEGDDGWEFKMSSGGLVAGLEGVKKKMPFIWIGWPGKWFPEEKQQSLTESLKANDCIPVYLPDDMADDYYNGFSNGVLWPLFHYLSEESGTNFRRSWWKAYKAANTLFADVVENLWQPGDLVWIHDYHLLMLPALLRQRIPNINTGLFLHIPFPSSELFQCLPVRKSILKGMLSCDLLGFHTFDYARHFLASCTRMLGLETSPAGLFFEGKYVAVSVNPVGIDPEKFLNQLATQETKKYLKDYSERFFSESIVWITSKVSDNDNSKAKGIPHRLRGLERFFQKYPQWREKVVLIQIAVPSRTDVKEYRRLKKEVDALVGHINGTYGSLDSNPVNYLFKSVAFPELCALYALSDAAIVTSVRDGMNLVAQEYIACQNEKHGVLVLSEFAGSAYSLGSGAILVNPWNVEEIADSIFEAITLSENEKIERHSHIYSFITRHTASRWGEKFIKDLDRVSRAAEKLNRTPKLTGKFLLPPYMAAKRRLLIFGSDGILISFSKIPFLAAPSRRTTNVIAELAKDPLNVIYIISGRGILELRHSLADRNTLLQWFGHLKIGLVAEYGFFLCKKSDPDPQKVKWHTMASQCDLSFLQQIKPIFQYFTDRTPGAFFEEKETSLTWHFRSTGSLLHSLISQKEPLDPFELKNSKVIWAVKFPFSLIADSVSHAHVVVGDKSLEVRPHECNYTTAIKRIMKRHTFFDFMLYVGEVTNVDFSEFDNEDQIFTCSVGVKDQQKFYLSDPEEVLQLLRSLAFTNENPSVVKVKD